MPTIIGQYIDSDIKRIVKKEYECEVGNVLYTYIDDSFEEAINFVKNRFRLFPYYNAIEVIEWMERQKTISKYENMITIKSNLFLNYENDWRRYNSPVLLHRDVWQIYDFSDKRWRRLDSIQEIDINQFKQNLKEI